MMAVVHGYINTVSERNWGIEDAVLVLIGVAMVVLFAFMVQRYRSKDKEYTPIKESAGIARKAQLEYV